MYDSKIWHPYTRHSAVPEIPVIERGEGVYLFDSNGRRYIDGISSWWCVNLGHAHPRVTAAIQEQAAILPHSILGNLSHPKAITLADRLAARMPSPDRHIVFASDGASAIEAGLRIAVQHFHNMGEAQRNQFVSLTDPYHGDTLGALSVGYMDSFHRPMKPLTFHTHRVATPQRKIADGGTSCRASLAQLDQTFAEHGRQIAAVVLESLCQGASGMRMYCPGFLAAIAERCATHGALLMCDEIAMGFGRTGTFFAFEQAGIDPDIVCLGKGITNGSLPLSAAVVRDALYETFVDGEPDRTFYHGHTFAGNPIAAAAALATLDVYEEEGVMGVVAERSAFLEEETRRRFDGHAAVKEVRCLGMIAALQLDKPKAEMASIREQLREAGVLLRPLGTCLYIMPPLVTSEPVLIEILDAVQAVL